MLHRILLSALADITATAIPWKAWFGHSYPHSGYIQAEFFNALYLGLPLKTIWEVQLIWNAAARQLSGEGYTGSDYITPVLKILYWLPISF